MNDPTFSDPLNQSSRSLLNRSSNRAGGLNESFRAGTSPSSLEQSFRASSSAILGMSGCNLDRTLEKIRQTEPALADSTRDRSESRMLAPPGGATTWRQSPLIQVVIMGLIFMFVFISFSTIQVFSAKLYGDQLGSNINLTLYGVFAFSCFVAPAITARLGCKKTMFCGILGYAALVVSGLIYFEAGGTKENPGSFALQAVPIIGGALLGFGAAILWTAQGQLILEYTTEENRGYYFGIFWAFFQAAALLGGVLALVYFNQQTSGGGGNSVLYIVFLVLIVVGAMGVFVLQNPQAVSEQAEKAIADAEVVHATPLQDFKDTCAMFATKRMLCLGLLFFYTGFNQPYQLNTFGRYFNKSSMAIEQIVFYALEVIAGLVFGIFLDNATADKRRARAILSLAMLAVITLLGYVFAYLHEHDHVDYPAVSTNTSLPMDAGNGSVEPLEPFKSGFWGPTFAMACWGLSDAMAQTYSYWLLGSLYVDGKSKAAAVSFYKMTQSIGWCIGFALVPMKRLAPINQLYATCGCFIAGALLSLMELPPVYDASLLDDDSLAARLEAGDE